MIDKMYESGVLGNESPQALQYKVFFELSPIWKKGQGGATQSTQVLFYSHER